MNDWLHEHHVVWLALAVFAAVFVLAAAVYLLVTRLATGERGRAFARVSPGMLPPLGVIFGLLVGFMAVQVWNDAEEARRAVDREASALRSGRAALGAVPRTPRRMRSRAGAHATRVPRSGPPWPTSKRR